MTREAAQPPALDALTARLAALDDAPLADHPEVLEAVQDALVAELEAIAGAGRPPAQRPRPSR